MILVGHQRANGRDLARHLTKDENERVQIHEIRGFVANDLAGAFLESEAISRGTRCKQHLYSLSLSPPKEADCDDATFMDAIDRAETRLGLEGQPRAVVFHEKRGKDGELRRHAHAVWCRIDMETMKAKQISFDHPKLNALARDLYIEHDWQMPRGFVSKSERNPRNYSLAEWQQAKRAERDPDALKGLFQDCYAISDGKAAFSHALKERGFILAKGDRRGFVAVDHKGEVYSLSRWVGKKPKELKAKLGTHDDLPSAQQAHAQAATIITDRLQELEAEEHAKREAEKQRIERERHAITAKARAQEAALQAAQHLRRKQEEADRATRIKRGLHGIWQRLTGERKKIEAQNRQEAQAAARRDQAEQQNQHRIEAAALTRAERRAAFLKERRQSNIEELWQDRRTLTPEFKAEAEPDRNSKRDAFKERRTRTPTKDRPRCGRSRSKLSAPSCEGPALEQ